jgi:hypothetical protein
VILLKLRIRESNNVLKERLQKLGSDMFITDYAGDIVNLLVNKPKAYRFLYDAQADLYMICDAWDYIHMDMMKQAFKDGWYITQKEFIEDWICDYYSGIAVDYWDAAVNSVIEFDEDDERDFSLINCDYDDSYIYPWVYCFGFIPNDDKDDDSTLRNDGYENSYKFSFGTVYTRNFDLSECDEMKTALNKADR